MKYGIVFFGAGLLVGAAVGYLGAGAKYKRLLAEQQAEEEFEDEDEDDDEDDSNEDLTENMIQEKRRSDDKLIKSHMDHYTAYDKISEENTRKANAEEKLQEAEETGINHAPYRITLNDFDEGTAGFNQKRLSYFIKDDILKEILKRTDVLVDGAYVDELRDISLAFRGSSNQRIIDVQKSLAENKVILWEEV